MISKMTNVFPPKIESLIGPLLGCLLPATVSSQPPEALLPLLSPTRRQRIQYLSDDQDKSWLLHLLRQPASAAQETNLLNVVNSKRDLLEPHPVSGEVEVDWDNIDVRYKRIDVETLHAQVLLTDYDLIVWLLWCGNNQSSGTRWTISDVSVPDSASLWGYPTIDASEENYNTLSLTIGANDDKDDDDDNDDYWNQYDNVSGQPTPAPVGNVSSSVSLSNGSVDEDEFYAQYGTVQPAMDNHDPDEQLQQGAVQSSLGGDEFTHRLQQQLSRDLATDTAAVSRPDSVPQDDHIGIVHPRPSSSSSSHSSRTVERLERQAEAVAGRESAEIGIKQHISSSFKSLYRLAKSTGIDREEFERLIRTELDVLPLLDTEEI
ncbi:hypothetical protein B0O99DRAFT_626657 [Bisporella sp. PMI_857]|nr:hypothetical protein B0O99DRAFT_626657 [Bisporella sp. PMI_857]